MFNYLAKDLRAIAFVIFSSALYPVISWIGTALLVWGLRRRTCVADPQHGYAEKEVKFMIIRQHL